MNYSGTREGKRGQASVAVDFCWLAGILTPPPPPPLHPSPLKLVFMVYCGHYIIEPLLVIQNDERGGKRQSVRGGRVGACHWVKA